MNPPLPIHVAFERRATLDRIRAVSAHAGFTVESAPEQARALQLRSSAPLLILEDVGNGEALFARVLATTHRAPAIARAERAAVYAGSRKQVNANTCRAHFLAEHRKLGLALHTEHIARLARLALTAGAPFADRWAGKLGGEVMAAAVSRASRPPPSLPRWKRARTAR